MDKFVVFVVLMVLSNHMVLYAHAIHPRARLLFAAEPVASGASNIEYAAEVDQVKAAVPGKPQVLAQQAQPPVQPTNTRIQFVDSIFQVSFEINDNDNRFAAIR